MNIVKSLGEIRKNHANFKVWELEQREKDAKREELARINPPSSDELKKAKDFGKTLIDVVDVMDQHSEDVAENIETATQIPMTFVPLATLFGSGFAAGKLIINPATKKEMEINSEFIKKNHDKINSLINKLQAEKPEKFKYLYSYELLSKGFVNNLKTSLHNKNEAQKLLKEFLDASKSQRTKAGIGITIPVVASVLSYVVGNVYATKMQVGGSKVARYQAREMLKDPKYFVSYTPEQVEEAKINLNNQAAKKKKKLHSGMFKSIASILKDNRAYDKWRKNYNPEAQKITRTLTKNELIQAEKDKEVIQRVIKKINNTAEVYSTDMEVAGNVLIGGTPFLGAAIGWGISAILGKTNFLQNHIQKIVDKYGDVEAKKAYEELRKVPEGGPGRNRLYLNFAWRMNNSEVKNEVNGTSATRHMKGIKNAERMKASSTSRLVNNLKKSQAIILAGKGSRNAVIAMASGFFAGIAGALIGLKLQKAASRAGRFTAKRELEQDPKNFIGYTQGDFDTVKTQPKKKSSKFKEMVSFLPRVFKQYFAYKHYKKHDLKQEEMLQDELIKLKINNKQLKDAKNLQGKVFNTFEQVDDKSQDYSESVELVTQTAQPFIFTSGLIAAVSPLIFLGVQAKRGKLTAKAITDKVITLLAGSSRIMKSNIFKKYLKGVAKNVPDVVRNTEVKSGKKLGEISDEINALKDNPAELKKLVESFIPDFNKLNIGKRLDEFKLKLEKMPDAEFEALKENVLENVGDSSFFNKVDMTTIDKKYLLKTIPKLQKIVENVPNDELKLVFDSLLDELVKNPEQFVELVKKGNVMQIFNTSGVKNALKVAGLSWAGFTLAFTFVMEAWFADMQLKAGRLGVMKALEELKDPAYYADSEPENKKINK